MGTSEREERAGKKQYLKRQWQNKTPPTEEKQ